jgi:hypothetical protein
LTLVSTQHSSAAPNTGLSDRSPSRRTVGNGFSSQYKPKVNSDLNSNDKTFANLSQIPNKRQITRALEDNCKSTAIANRPSVQYFSKKSHHFLKQHPMESTRVSSTSYAVDHKLVAKRNGSVRTRVDCSYLYQHIPSLVDPISQSSTSTTSTPELDISLEPLFETTGSTLPNKKRKTRHKRKSRIKSSLQLPNTKVKDISETTLRSMLSTQRQLFPRKGQPFDEQLYTSSADYRIADNTDCSLEPNNQMDSNRSTSPVFTDGTQSQNAGE